MTDSDLDRLAGQLGSLDRKIEEVRRALLGEETLGHTGLVTRVGNIEQDKTVSDRQTTDARQRIHERIDGAQRKLDRIIWISAGAGLGGAVSGGGIVALIMRATGTA